MAASHSIVRIVFGLTLTAAVACGSPELQGSTQGEQPSAHDSQHTSSRAVDDPAMARSRADVAFALSVEGDAIALRRDALGHLFALKPQLIEANNAPRVQLGAMKLVTFTQHGEVLAMMEPALHAVYTTLPAERLLQTFPILRQDSTHVVFAWPIASGSLFLRDPQAPADLPPLVREYMSAQDPVLTASDGLLQGLVAQEGVVTLQHVVRATSEMPQNPIVALLGGQLTGAQLMTTFYSSIQLSPYSDNPQYLPKIQSSSAPPYFLQVPRGQLHASDIDYIAMTWDTHNGQDPIVFDIAADVPKELLPAIVDGVQYWNRAAQKTLATVNTGVALGLTPRPRHVPIRWIPWHRPGGVSIAEMQPDPLTGEILAAEIYLASSFYEPSPQLLAHATQTTWQAHMNGLTCMAPRVPAPTLLEAVQDSDGRAFVQRAMADNMRAVVAHEVGHTLGLRHNFAASLDGLPLQLTGPKSKRGLWQAYTGGDTGGAKLSSSVMDYLPDIDSMLVGAFIKEGVLPFDAWVMGHGYGPQNERVSDGAWDGQEVSPWLFCSDGERLGGMLGCRQFDSSPNPFAGALIEAQETLRHLPLELVLQLAPPGQAPLDEAGLKRALAALRMEHFTLHTAMITQELFNGLRAGVLVLPVERRMGYLRHSDPLAYNQANVALRKEWLDEVGGLPGLLQGLLGAPGSWDGRHSPTILGWIPEALFLGPARLDKKNEQLLRQYVPTFASALEQALLTDVLLTLTGEGPKVGKNVLAAIIDPLGRGDGGRGGLDPALVDAAWEKPLCSWAEDLIMATGAPLEGGRGSGIRKPKLTLDARMAALRLLAPEVFHLSHWGLRTRERLAQDLLQRLFVLVDQKLLLQKSDANATVRTLGLAGFEELLQLPLLPEAERLWAKDELQLVRVIMSLNATKRLPLDTSNSGAISPF